MDQQTRPIRPDSLLEFKLPEPQVRDAIRSGAMRIDHIAGADHTFSNLGPRRVLIDESQIHHYATPD